MLGDITVLGIVVVLISILIAMAVHEAAHAYIGLRLGDDTAAEAGRVSLNPFRHIDPFMTVILPVLTLVTFGVPILAAKPVPFNPGRVRFEEFGAALIAAAGPLTNLVLATIGALLAHIVGGGTIVHDALQIFVVLNVAIFVFNLVPIPPLDGSRVLYAFAPDSIRNFMEQLEQFGIFIVFGLVLLVPAFGALLVNINQSILTLLGL